MTHRAYTSLSPKHRRNYKIQVVIGPGGVENDYRFPTKEEAYHFAEIYGPHRARLFDYTASVFGTEIFLPTHQS